MFCQPYSFPKMNVFHINIEFARDGFNMKFPQSPFLKMLTILCLVDKFCETGSVQEQQVNDLCI